MNTFFYDAISKASRKSAPSWAENLQVVEDPVMLTRFQTYTQGDTRWAVFCPTRKTLNWVMNFVFPHLSFAYNNTESPIRMHAGFLFNYVGYLRGSLHTIIRNDKGIKKYVFTGRSLGGALARIGALDIQYNYDIIPTVRAFGEPNIGNKEFEESYSKRIQDSKSYRTARDIVPLCPPTWMGYSTPQKILLPKGKKFWFWEDHEFSVYKDGLEEVLI